MTRILTPTTGPDSWKSFLADPDKQWKTGYFTVCSGVERNAKWRYMARVRRVCKLKSPVTLQRMREDRELRTSSFIRAQIQGRPKVTAHWPAIYGLIAGLNRPAEKPVRKFQPEFF
jgi:predicted RNA-binding protein with PUA-like domain